MCALFIFGAGGNPRRYLGFGGTSVSIERKLIRGDVPLRSEMATGLISISGTVTVCPRLTVRDTGVEAVYPEAEATSAKVPAGRVCSI